MLNINLQASQRGRNIPDFMVLSTLQKAIEMQNAGEDIQQLAAGEPALGIPKAAAGAAIEAISQDKIRYTPAAGFMPLRTRIAEFYLEKYDIMIPAERIILTIGASGGFIFSFLAAFDVGDHIALAAPSYPCYRNLLECLGLEIVLLESDINSFFQVTYQHIKTAHEEKNLKGIIIANPTNPTGAMISNEELEKIVNYCHTHNIWVICDEIYHGICYHHHYQSALKYNDNCIIINSFSKYFSMTGWRLGWIVVPDILQDITIRMAQNFFVSPPAVSQYAALKVFDCQDELNNRVVNYRKNRDYMIEKLPELGIKPVLSPDGGFYIYADVSDISDNSLVLANNLLEKANIATASGLDFDLQNGHKYLRFSFVGDFATIEKSIQNMHNYIYRNH